MKIDWVPVASSSGILTAAYFAGFEPFESSSSFFGSILTEHKINSFEGSSSASSGSPQPSSQVQSPLNFWFIFPWRHFVSG